MKELLPFITTFVGQAIALAPAAVIAVAAATTQQRWVTLCVVSHDDGAAGKPAQLQTTIGAIPIATQNSISSLGTPCWRRLPQSDNALQFQNLGAVPASFVWTVVVADAPMNILSGAVGIINNRQAWGA